MKDPGLVLIEILVALSVLAIGAVGLAGLQLVTLRLAAATEANGRLLHAAESELQHRLLGLGAGAGCTALAAEELAGIECRVHVQGCSTTLTGFDCAPGVSGGPQQVTVEASLGEDRQVVLSAVTRQAAPGSPP